MKKPSIEIPWLQFPDTLEENLLKENKDIQPVVCAETQGKRRVTEDSTQAEDKLKRRSPVAGGDVLSFQGFKAEQRAPEEKQQVWGTKRESCDGQEFSSGATKAQTMSHGGHP